MVNDAFQLGTSEVWLSRISSLAITFGGIHEQIYDILRKRVDARGSEKLIPSLTITKQERKRARQGVLSMFFHHIDEFVFLMRDFNSRDKTCVRSLTPQPKTMHDTDCGWKVGGAQDVDQGGGRSA